MLGLVCNQLRCPHPHHRTTAAPWSSPWNLPLFVMQTLDIRHSKTTDQWWSISWISRKHMSRLVKGPMWTSAIGLLYQSHPITIYKWCLTNPQKGPLCRALCERIHQVSPITVVLNYTAGNWSSKVIVTALRSGWRPTRPGKRSQKTMERSATFNGQINYF